MQVFVATLAGLLAAAFSRTAVAADGVPLTVVRSAGAATCPSQADLLGRIGALGGTLRPQAAFQVEFAREADGFSATIRDQTTGAARLLRAAGDSCAPLSQATALALVLLFDSAPLSKPDTSGADTAATAEAPTGNPTGSPPSDDAVAPRSAATPNELGPGKSGSHATAQRETSAASVSVQQAHSNRAGVSLGLAAIAGVVRPVAPAVAAEIAAEVQRFRVAMLGLLSIPSDLALGPGGIRVWLWGGGIHTCLLLTHSAVLRLDACSGFYLAAQQAAAFGFTTNERATRLWLAIPVGLALGSATRGLGFRLGASALLPLVRHEFTVARQGSAYRAAPVGGLVTLQAAFGFGR